MSDTKTKTLTLKRPRISSPEYTGQNRNTSSQQATVTVRRGRKTIVHVVQPPAWKKKKNSPRVQVEPHSALKAKPSVIPPKKQEKVVPMVSPKPVKSPRRARLLPIEEAMEELATYWPALFAPGEWKMMQIGLREQLCADIERRQLPLSKKKLNRCLRTVSWCPDYLAQMVEDAPRYDLNGIVVGYVTAEQQEYAQTKRVRSLSRLNREEEDNKKISNQ